MTEQSERAPRFNVAEALAAASARSSDALVHLLKHEDFQAYLAAADAMRYLQRGGDELTILANH
jgi:hypothetical protein